MRNSSSKDLGNPFFEGWMPLRRACRATLPLLLAGLFLAALPVVALAQPTATAAPEAAPAAEAPAKPPVEDLSRPMGPPDPFNRGTPRGSMYGFLSAARKDD